MSLGALSACFFVKIANVQIACSLKRVEEEMMIGSL